MTKDMFYKLLIAAVVAGVAITVLSSLVGCQAPYRGVGDYQADDKKTVMVFRPKRDAVPSEPVVIQPKIDTAALEAKIDQLQSKLDQFVNYQAYHTAQIAKDRSDDVARDKCFDQCMAKWPWQDKAGHNLNDQYSERELQDRRECQDKCSAMPHSPGNGGC